MQFPGNSLVRSPHQSQLGHKLSCLLQKVNTCQRENLFQEKQLILQQTKSIGVQSSRPPSIPTELPKVHSCFPCPPNYTLFFGNHTSFYLEKREEWFKSKETKHSLRLPVSTKKGNSISYPSFGFATKNNHSNGFNIPIQSFE